MRHLLIAAAAALLTPAAAAAAPPSPAEREALEALAARNDGAWNAADAVAVSADYASDGSLRLTGMAAALEGRDAVRAYFEKAFAARPATFRHVTRLQAIDMVAPGVALADAEVRVEQLKEGRWELARRFLNHSVLKRDGGAWRIQAVRAHLVP
jgi:uncharacterized protein (TIGR02246 family)